MKTIFIACIMLIALFTQTHEFTILLKNGSERELKAKEQLERIIEQYAEIINICVPTDTIVIDEFVQPPHSHPVLTLNTRYLRNDTLQLASLLHEGLHWWIDQRYQQMLIAVKDHEKTFPNAPDKGPEGAANKFSTYLHLIGCDLEFQAMTMAIGEPAARKSLSARPYYTWVYSKVLTDTTVRAINRQHGFILPGKR